MVMMKRTVNSGDFKIEYVLTRKKVKNINLRVKNNGTVTVSANNRVSIEFLDRFVIKNADFIMKALIKIKGRHEVYLHPELYIDGESILIFGKTFTLCIIEDVKNIAYVLGDKLFISVKDKNDIDLKKRVLNKFLSDLCKKTVLDVCKRVYPRFSSNGIAFPEIKFRKMKSKWGSCQYLKGIITFNTHLVHASVKCIEFVVVHEFLHFIYADHSKQFHNAMSNYMPHWKERKSELNKVVIDI
jgi:predicted metal-dependent hydrolase